MTAAIPRIGTGIDVHPFDPLRNAPLVLCGVTIPNAPALAGHSDADVGAHAVADALLGAAALGDLGSKFGVDVPEVADAISMVLLASVVSDVGAAGFAIGNIDLTLIAQRPRLAGFRGQMRANLAETCHLDVDRVSVKFTTTDRLGAIGRGEGIAGWCSVMIGTAS